ncbi:deaminase domain-containing protein [Peribacillus frigoritolerans]|uniref:deaminase domain-containing protein n=1 Tax=Peribacillus frigoritolerans TaxID=450367 RepID=UPI003F7F84B9
MKQQKMVAISPVPILRITTTIKCILLIVDSITKINSSLEIFKDKYTIGYRPELKGRTNAFITKVYNEVCSEHSEKWNRWDDRESKILEQIAFEQKEEFKHNIVLWTKRYPCPSCRCVIIEFEKKYRVNVNVYYEYNNNPCDKGGVCDDN